MPLIRRIAALVSGLLLLQLTLLGGDGACGSQGQRDRSMGAMAAADPSHAHAPPSSGDDCDVRHPPGACVSMPSCASTVVPPPAVVPRIAVASASGVLPEPIVVVSHAVGGPDVPPPRA
jgi:hypothetical protein